MIKDVAQLAHLAALDDRDVVEEIPNRFPLGFRAIEDYEETVVGPQTWPLLSVQHPGGSSMTSTKRFAGVPTRSAKDVAASLDTISMIGSKQRANSGTAVSGVYRQDRGTQESIEKPADADDLGLARRIVGLLSGLIYATQETGRSGGEYA